VEAGMHIGGGRGGRRGGTSCTPLKGFENFCLKNAIKHEKR